MKTNTAAASALSLPVAVPLALLMAVAGPAAQAQQAQEPPAAAATTLEAVKVEATAVAENTVGQTVEDTPSTSLQDVFANDASVSVGGPTGFSQKVYVNGVEEQNLNVQVDGVRQSNNIWHHNSNLLIDPGLIKAVSVDAGVAPADAGPGAVGGSLRYETRDVADLLPDGRNFGAFIGGAYESNAETWRESGAVYGRSQGFEALGYLSHGEGKNYEDGDGRQVQGTGVNLLSTLGKLAYTGAGGHRLEANLQYLLDDDIRPFRANFAGVRDTVTLAPNKFERSTASLEYSSTQPTDRLDPLLRVYYNGTGIDRPSADGNFARGYFEARVDSIGATAQNSFRTPLGRLTGGLDFFEDQTEVDNFRDPLFEEKASNIGAFVQLRSKPVEALDVSAGLRYDYNDFTSVDHKSYDDDGFSPNLSLRYALLPGLGISGAYNYVFGGMPLTAVGNFHATQYVYADDLKSQKSRNGKLGIDYSVHGLRLDAEYFSTTIKNSAAYDEENAPALRINGPQLETEGFNLGASYAWNHAEAGLSYTNTDIQYDNADIGTNAFALGTPVGELFKLHGAWLLPSLGLKFGATGEIALKFDYPASSSNVDLDDYEVFNVYGQWQPTTLRALLVRLELNNLADAAYTNRYTSGASLGFVQPLQDPGRNIVLSARYTF